MILDTSVLVAMLKAEPEARALGDAMRTASPELRMSVATYVEVGAVIDRLQDPILSRRLDQLIIEFNVKIEPVTVEQGHLARSAYRDFGRGSQHPAKLNFGDCFSYALAKALDEPLLFKGQDFLHTDIELALY